MTVAHSVDCGCTVCLTGPERRASVNDWGRPHPERRAPDPRLPALVDALRDVFGLLPADRIPLIGREAAATISAALGPEDGEALEAAWLAAVRPTTGIPTAQRLVRVIRVNDDGTADVEPV